VIAVMMSHVLAHQNNARLLAQLFIRPINGPRHGCLFVNYQGMYTNSRAQFDQGWSVVVTWVELMWSGILARRWHIGKKMHKANVKSVCTFSDKATVYNNI